MKIEVMTPRKVEIDAVRVTCRVTHEEELEGIPPHLLEGDRLDITLDLDTKRARDWPAGQRGDIHVKVADSGSYELLSGESVFATAQDCYVPEWLPGEHYGDYLILSIDEDGTVEGWDPDPESVAATVQDEGE